VTVTTYGIVETHLCSDLAKMLVFADTDRKSNKSSRHDSQSDMDCSDQEEDVKDCDERKRYESYSKDELLDEIIQRDKTVSRLKDDFASIKEEYDETLVVATVRVINNPDKCQPCYASVTIIACLLKDLLAYLIG